MDGSVQAGTDRVLWLDLGSERVAVELRRSDRARRLSLRIDGRRGVPVLVMPRLASRRAAYGFAVEHLDWLAAQLARLPPHRPFADGARFPLRGTEITISHDPGGRGVARVEGEVLRVTGEAPHLARRVRDFLKREARRELGAAMQDKARELGLTPGRLSIRDQASRWGSCTARGDIAFSFRLICAPPFVADYVVAHEVAHLVHMNHSAVFWRVVDSLTDRRDAAREWLRTHGAALHRIG